MLKMTIDNEEVVSDKDITINEEMLSASSTILNNVYPKEWEEDKDYTSKFYYPQDYSKALIQRSYVTQEAEAGTTIQVNGSVTLTDVDTTKNSRVLRLLGQTSQTGTPTPSSPIPVNVVSGDNEINICGKNLLNIENSNIHLLTNWDGTTVINNSYNSMIIDTRNKSSITISGDFTNIESGGIRYGLYTQYPSTSTTGTRNNLSASGTINTTNANYILLSFQPATNKTFTNIQNSIQVEYGSATTYEPYKGNTYPLYLGVENLFDKSTNIISNKGLTTTGGTFDSDTVSIKNFLEVQPNTTYTYSGYDDTSVRKRVCMYSSNSEASFLQESSGTNATLTFTTTSTTKYIRFQFKTSEINNIQLEKGNKQNTFTPYGTTPIELCKIGNYQDYIYKDSGKWYLHKEIGKVVFTGGDDETWNIDNAVQRTVYTGISTLIKSPTNNDTQLSAFTNLLQTKSFNEVYSSKLQGISCSTGGNLSLHINGVTDTGSLTLESWKNWLSTHNISLYYVLATPTNTEITDTTLISQLNALSSQ